MTNNLTAEEKYLGELYLFIHNEAERIRQKETSAAEVRQDKTATPARNQSAKTNEQQIGEQK